MKNLKRKLNLLTLVIALGTSTMAQDKTEKDSTGLPGDNFDLRSALELFKNSETPEDFEKKLNAEDSKVNNLDLNNDGEIDYIKVVSYREADAQVLVLQVAVSETESQDVASIEIEKDGEESAKLQITGNENLYGKETMVEPIDEKEKPVQGKGAGLNYSGVFVSINVWSWPCVHYIFSPGYVLWVSPWYWRHYPVWWHPWRPHPWRVYYGWSRPWYPHYRIIARPRVVYAHQVYYGHRTNSTIVRSRNDEKHIRNDNRKSNRTDVKHTSRDKHSKNKAMSKGRNQKRANNEMRHSHRK